MALVVEDGSARVDAESYASVSAADVYAGARSNPSGWLNLPASVELVLTTQPLNGETLTIGARTYTFQDALTDADGNIAIGGSLAATQQRLSDAINLSGSAGSDYAASMTKNAQVRAMSWSDNRLEIRARQAGTAGNAIGVSETFDAEENLFDGDALSGGSAHVSLKAKEAALRKATEYLDRRYKRRWKGARFREDQALDWPRCGALDADHYLIDSDIIPKELECATIEAALAIVAGLELDPDITTPGTIIRKKVKAGPVEQDIEYGSAGASQKRAFRRVEDYLRVLIRAPGEIVRA